MRLLLLLATCCLSWSASETPPTLIAPLIDVPLRNPSVCRGGDGAWYLTGTTADRHPDGELDFRNNSGIQLWRSSDRINWQDLGVVWKLRRGVGDFGNDFRWQQYYRLGPDGTYDRGILSPEISFHEGTYYLTFAMSGGGTGLLRASDPRGPWEQVARLTTRGEDASLFFDVDGSAYWVWGMGWIARLRDDLRALAETPRLLTVSGEGAPGVGPLTVGQRGATLIHFNGRYHLIATETTNRLGAACADTFVAEATNLYGPYGPQRRLAPHAGEVTVFFDENGTPYSTFGGDAAAVFQDRAGLIELVDDGFLKHLSIHSGRNYRTEGGPIARLRGIDLPNTGIRDPQILLADNGFYYLTGTTSKDGLRAPGLRLFRSADLRHWEPLGDEHGVVWYCDESAWTSKPFTVRNGERSLSVHDFWAPEIHFVNGNYYIPFCMFSGGSGMLRSVSGKPEGPYEDVVGRLHEWAGDPSLFVDDDGSAWMHLGFGPTQLVRMKDDMSGFAGDPFVIGPHDSAILGHEGGYIAQILGKYVLFYTTLNGEEEAERKAKPRPHNYATYDFVYCWADDLRGPYSAPRIFAPHGGHGAVFHAKDGQLMATMFGTDSSAPFRSTLGIYPVDARLIDGELILRPATSITVP